MQVYAPTPPYSEKNINSFNNDVDETLGKPYHNMIVMGNCNGQIWKRIKPYGNGNGQLWARNDKRKTYLGITKKVESET